MAKIDNEGIEQIKIVKNALNSIYEKLENNGIFGSVQEEFQFISETLDLIETEWELIDNTGSHPRQPQVVIDGQAYKPAGV